MNKEQLEAFAREAAKSIKSESDLNDFRKILKIKGTPIFRTIKGTPIFKITGAGTI